jgi:hypothetical protein
MAWVRVEAGHIKDWGSFHRAFAEAMGFLGDYGQDMDAWIERMFRVGEMHVPRGRDDAGHDRARRADDDRCRPVDRV